MPIYPGDIKTNLFQTNYLSINGFNNHRLEIKYIILYVLDLF